MNEKKVMLSGIQPSGELHIGNYLGPLRSEEHTSSPAAI